MNDYWIALMFFGGIALLVWLNRHQTEENDQIDEDDNHSPTFQPAHKEDGDYWCPICGYHSTYSGYFDAHLMNDHRHD